MKERSKRSERSQRTNGSERSRKSIPKRTKNSGKRRRWALVELRPFVLKLIYSGCSSSSLVLPHPNILVSESVSMCKRAFILLTATQINIFVRKCTRTQNKKSGTGLRILQCTSSGLSRAAASSLAFSV